MTRLRMVVVVPMLASLVGCGAAGDVRQLAGELDKLRQAASGSVEAAPVFVPAPRFVYDPASLRDPFQSPEQVPQVGRMLGRPGPAPDFQRPRGLLEGFAVEQFQMVGTLSLGVQTFALVRGAGGVHRLAVGDYLGPDYGRVTIIREADIEILEHFPDGQGGWLERSRSLVLSIYS